MSNAEKYALGPVPEIAGADYARVPIDKFRAAVAKVVADAWDETPEKIFPGVDLGKKGADFAVATPRFKKGKPDEWVQKVLDAVSQVKWSGKSCLGPPKRRCASSHSKARLTS